MQLQRKDEVVNDECVFNWHTPVTSVGLNWPLALSGDLIQLAFNRCHFLLERIACVEARTDQGLMTETLRGELRRFFKKRSGRRPLVLPVLMEI